MPWQRPLETPRPHILHNICIGPLDLHIVSLEAHAPAYEIVDRAQQVQLLPDDPHHPPEDGPSRRAGEPPERYYTYRNMTGPELRLLELANLVGRRVCEAIRDKTIK